MTDTKASTEYLVTYAKTLREGGAPHQQELADHIEAVVDAGPALAEHAAKDEQIEQLKKNVEQLVDERNAARDMNDKTQKAHDEIADALSKANDTMAEQNKRIQELTEERDKWEKALQKANDAADNAAEESHANLKKKSKS